MINPSLYMDHDGAYRGLDHEIHNADDFINYTVFSVWDTYRALHPLFNLFYPSRSKDIIAFFETLSTECTRGFTDLVAYG